MKNLMKPMIVLGMILFLLGAMAGCKEKNEEKEIEELVEKLGEAKTEKEVAEIAEKIEKLEQRAKKSAKEVSIKMGQAFMFWNEVATLSDDVTQFSMTFENIAITEETILGERKAGKKYIMILAKTKNLGPRESFRASSGRDIQIKTDKGYLYRFQSYPGAFPSTFFSSEPPFPLDYKAFDSWQRPLGGFRTVDRFAESLEPEETGWTIYWTAIPEDNTLVELFAQFPTEQGRYGGEKRTNFRLELTQFGERTAGGGGDTIDSISDEEMIWAKCNNPACKAEYQTSKKGYFKYIEEHANPMAPTAPPMVCEKCGEQSVFRAEKCGNPDCGIVFFRGAVPNDFPDRCPECGYSTTEETRKARLSGR